MKYQIFVLFFGVLIAILSCKKDQVPEISPLSTEGEPVPVLPDTPYDYTAVNFPASFDEPPLSFLNSTSSANPITNDGATLGRVLFYDKNLSLNKTRSCASCHDQSKAFSDGEMFSKGLYDGLTGRNSMAIMNTRFSFRFFWDQRSLYVENQVLEPIKNHIEMDMSLDALVERLKAVNYYPPLFEKAFGTSEITTEKISFALAQFIHSLVTYNSKYDLGTANNFSNFSQLELDGKNLFMSGSVNCNNCHSTANFYATDARTNGLDSNPLDSGLAHITLDPADVGKFKVPTLRNIEVTGPYMHDGRFSTLEEVIEHYNSGLQPHPNLDDRLASNGQTGGPPKQYNLTDYQKASLVAFLKTLTDYTFLNDIKFSDPFQ